MLESLEATIAPRDFKVVQRMIYEQAGIALADSKQIMVHSRLAKRLRELNIASYSEYLDLLQKDPDSEEMVRFINALTTNKTDFFRENHHFQFLEKHLFPSLKMSAEKSGNRKLRIWCAASSTGEEPYSIAMSVRNFFGQNTDWDIRILASDIDTQVLTVASNGCYTHDRFADVPPGIQKLYFDRISREDDSDWSAKQTLRDLITFRRINLQAEWPIQAQFDVIFCRNVMIYFDAPTQKRLVERFREKLTDNGHLIIGHSESLFGLSDQFSSIGDTIYQKTNQGPGEQRSRSSSVLSASPRSKPATSGMGSDENKTAAHPTFHSAKNTSNKSAVVPTARTSDNTRSNNEPKVPIIVGEVHASSRPEWITTLLGSCIATCLYDEEARVGGMNHFMLPESATSQTQCASFGVHAMELLINRIMRLGGERRRLKAKVFGGSAVINTTDSWNVGAKNIAFAFHFLETEGIPVVSSHTGGKTGMQIQFHTHTAKVMVRELDQNASKDLLSDELQRANDIGKRLAQHKDITLF